MQIQGTAVNRGPDTELFWSDSGAYDLRWRARRNCSGLRNALRVPKPRNGCGICTKELILRAEELD
eukprot:5810821-Alexandrium_andersonii.AAC.1